MLKRFVSAASVGAVLVGLAALTLYLGAASKPEGRYLLATVWCIVPAVWGLWALVAPASWVPDRLPAWGALLGAVAGIVAGFVLDIPARVFDAPTTLWTGLVVLVVAVVMYGLVWTVVKRVYVELAGQA